MARDPRATRVDPDGVRIIDRRGPRRDVWLAVAVGIACIALVLGLRRGADRTGTARAPVPAPERSRVATEKTAADVPSPPAADAGAHRVSPSAAPAAVPAAHDGSDGGEVPRAHPLPREAAPPAEQPTAEITGERTGIALFPPPGTKPTRIGIVVPEDFPLPPGYVRHYQTTDDGQDLPAILMFSPDYTWVDAEGRPIALPEDRIVPPELAPPGLPIQMLEPPEKGSGRP